VCEFEELPTEGGDFGGGGEGHFCCWKVGWLGSREGFTRWRDWLFGNTGEED